MFLKIFWRLGVVTIALAILFLSVTRAGLELIAQEGGTDLLKKQEINFLVTTRDGETVPSTYKFPEAGMLPDNVMYGFKRVRDYFWVVFSGGINKAKLSVLMADKKVVEYSELVEKDKNDLAIESGNEAIDKLEYADGLVTKMTQADDQIKQIRQQLFLAGFAYKESFIKYETKFSFEGDKYSKLINRIDERNKDQEAKRYSWDY